MAYSIVTATRAAARGLHVHLTEPGTGTGRTRGHCANHPGLHGHSVDPDTYPWRIVCGYWRNAAGELLPIWDVAGTEGTHTRYRVGENGLDDAEACRLAHRKARLLKRQWPEGRIEPKRNFGGDIAGLAERLAGCTLLLSRFDGPLVTYEVSQYQHGVGRLYCTRIVGDRREPQVLDVLNLATAEHLGAEILRLPGELVELFKPSQEQPS